MRARKRTELPIAIILLRKTLRFGAIFMADNAKFVWQSAPVFMAHNLDKYWTKLNRIDAENNDISGMRCAVL